MGTAHINGTDIHFTDTGDPGTGRRPLLFSHGFLMNHTMFDPQVAAFRDRHRCIAWDERGFGHTRAPGEFTYWDSADDAVALLDHLGIDEAVLLGMSQGGFLSLRAALAHPDRVTALVLIDSQAGVDDDETLEGYRQMSQAMQHGSDEERAGVFAVVSGLILGDERLAAEWIPQWDALDRDQIALAAQALLGRDDITDRIGEITCPILAVHGTDDQAIDIEHARLIAEHAPDHRGVVPIEGAAHAPNLTHPAEVNAAITEFLDGLADPSADQR